MIESDRQNRRKKEYRTAGEGLSDSPQFLHRLDCKLHADHEVQHISVTNRLFFRIIFSDIAC